MAQLRPATRALDPDGTITPRPLPALREAVRVANIVGKPPLRVDDTVLPGLYAELHTAANTWTGTDRADAFGLLAEAYRCAHTVGIAAGYPDQAAARHRGGQHGRCFVDGTNRDVSWAGCRSP